MSSLAQAEYTASFKRCPIAQAGAPAQAEALLYQALTTNDVLLDPVAAKPPMTVTCAAHLSGLAALPLRAEKDLLSHVMRTWAAACCHCSWLCICPCSLARR